MVVGLGIDVVEVGRLQDALGRYGERFLRRVFTEEERRYCAEKRYPAQSLAGRFAAKEAAAKALGTGLSRGVTWQELEVLRRPGDAPQLRLHGRARDRALELGAARTALSLTHTDHYATAVVILESGPLFSGDGL